MAFNSVRRPFGWVRQRGRAHEPDPAPEPTPEHGQDELQELGETFRQTVDRLASLVRELETAHRLALEAEREKKQFYREIIRAVTLGRFDLVDPEDVPTLGTQVADVPVTTGREYATARDAINAAAEAVGMSEDRACDFLLAAGEAISNSLKHARDGRCLVYRTEDGLVIRITDRGDGIQSANLPAAILLPGFSTKVSLGMGYKMMLKLCDHVWLSTGPEGTIVQCEKKIVSPPQDPMLESWERL